MKFYRLQDNRFLGAYMVASRAFKGMGMDEILSPKEQRHPIPSDDTLLKKNVEGSMRFPKWSWPWDRFHYGFTSPEQLRTWFYTDSSLLRLREVGVFLYVYEVSDSKMFVGHTQAVVFSEEFEKIKTTPVEVIDLKTLTCGV